jgi:hypothetical protein
MKAARDGWLWRRFWFSPARPFTETRIKAVRSRGFPWVNGDDHQQATISIGTNTTDRDLNLWIEAEQTSTTAWRGAATQAGIDRAIFPPLSSGDHRCPILSGARRRPSPQPEHRAFVLDGDLSFLLGSTVGSITPGMRARTLRTQRAMTDGWNWCLCC